MHFLLASFSGFRNVLEVTKFTLVALECLPKRPRESKVKIIKLNQMKDLEVPFSVFVGSLEKIWGVWKVTKGHSCQRLPLATGWCSAYRWLVLLWWPRWQPLLCCNITSTALLMLVRSFSLASKAAGEIYSMSWSLLWRFCTPENLYEIKYFWWDTYWIQRYRVGCRLQNLCYSIFEQLLFCHILQDFLVLSVSVRTGL